MPKRRGSLWIAALLAAACATPPEGPPGPADAPASSTVELSRGYALLHALVAQVAEVDGALLVTSGSDAYDGLIVDIAEHAETTRSMLEGWAETDPTIALAEPALPAIERETRDLKADRIRARLMIGFDNDELRLLLTQVEATGYASALATVLSRRESHPERRAALDEVAEIFSELNASAVARIRLR